MYSHILVTRYGIGISNPEWYDYKIDLFRSITLPSVATQAREKFFWMIVIDAFIPPEALESLRAAVEPHPFIHLITIDPLEQPRMMHGGFAHVYERCQDYLLGNGLIVDPNEYVITSLIDDDDAWHKGVVNGIDRHIAMHDQRLIASEQENRGYLVRHSAGMFMTFATGIVWDVLSERYEITKAPAHSMSIFVFCRFSSNISACTVRHGSWPSFVVSVGFETHVVDQHCGDAEPMWIYLRHPRAISQITGPESGSAVDDAALRGFSSQFSIDLALLSNFLAAPRTSAINTNGSADHEKFDLLDLQFRISSYRRQLEAISEKLRYLENSREHDQKLTDLRLLKSIAAQRLLELEARFREGSKLQC